MALGRGEILAKLFGFQLITVSDGEIFAAIRDGIGPDFAMDAFRLRLTEPDIWNLVSYLKTLR